MKMTDYKESIGRLAIEDMNEYFENMMKKNAFAAPMVSAMQNKSGIEVSKENAESLCELLGCGCSK